MARHIRFAQASDAHAVERIENDADQLLVDYLHADVWSAAPPGITRLSESGFLLAVDVDGEVAGFVQVLEVDGNCHLEQLSVAPAQQGLGRALVEAAKDQARERGYERISLRTYARVPWNAPFYATAGFAEEAPATSFHRSLLVVEAEHGLDRHGRRVQMSAPLRIMHP
ncbi:putative N-acetyltransferase YhbS [Curtobacterium sp. JUb34]|uniref:GNAT family N-acetyltransferase n=1 Tax=Curtobacterium sp. JUb34 TaxID=2485109 RepID=UPI000F47F8DD|nr:GNAT family N-acetyltransferase [Curtobacterium sp. JUb34]ROR30296.1 putative N-acetyltransferase YhbS [Curtobacterium sp. JUb34]